jgi:hypothetical protein
MIFKHLPMGICPHAAQSTAIWILQP